MGRLQRFFLGAGSHDESLPPPRFLKFRSSKAFILTTICIAVFTDIFLYGAIVPVVPFSLSSRAGVGEDEIQSWVSILLAVYGAALLVISPLAGWYADVSSSRRMPLLVGLVALAGSTIMLCLARDIALLITGRVLQGIAAGIVWTVGQALLVDTVGQKEIGQVMGYVSISMSLGYLIAPLLGGVVYDKAGYYAVYFMCFGLIFLDIILRMALIEKKIAGQWIQPDQARGPETTMNSDDKQLALSSTERALDTAMKHASQQQKASEETSCRTAAVNTQNPVDSPACSNVFEPAKPTLENRNSSSPSPQQEGTLAFTGRNSRKSKYPPVFTLLGSRRLLAALWGCLVQASLMTAFDAVAPTFVKRVFQWNSVGAGLTFLALIVPSFLAPIVGAVSDRYGPRWLVVAGFILAAPFWILLRLVTYDSIGQKVLFCALLGLIGVTLTITMPPLMAEIAYIVEAKEKKSPGIFGNAGAYAQAYGLFVMAFAAGTLIGPIWSGFVEASAGWSTMTWTLGLFSLCGALPALIWTGGLITRENAKSGGERAIGVRPAYQQAASEVLRG